MAGAVIVIQTTQNYRAEEVGQCLNYYSEEQLAAKLASDLNLKSEFGAEPGRYLGRLVLRDEQGDMSASSKTVEIP